MILLWAKIKSGRAYHNSVRQLPTKYPLKRALVGQCSGNVMVTDRYIFQIKHNILVYPIYYNGSFFRIRSLHCKSLFILNFIYRPLNIPPKRWGLNQAVFQGAKFTRHAYGVVYGVMLR